MSERTDDFMSSDEIELAGGDDELGNTDETAEIRAEIHETRERIGDNLEQLGERLNPGNIKDRVKQDIRDATIGKVENMAQSAADQWDEAKETLGDAQRTMMDVIRDNPIPAAMVGIGLGWLAYNASQRGSQASSRSGRARSGRAFGSGYGYGGSAYGAGRFGSGGYPGAETGEEDTIDRVRDQASELSDEAQRKASELADRAQGMAQNLADETRHRARRIEDQFHDNPLAMGAAALTLGMAAGLAIPETRREDELMGGARDKLAEKTRDMVEETRDKVENVAGRVVDQAKSTAKSAAREEGLTSS